MLQYIAIIHITFLWRPEVRQGSRKSGLGGLTDERGSALCLSVSLSLSHSLVAGQYGGRNLVAAQYGRRKCDRGYANQHWEAGVVAYR
eukprot:10044856-Karenia_brevis.AAC.1